MRFERTDIDITSSMYAAIDDGGIIGLVTVKLDVASGEKTVTFKAKGAVNAARVIAAFVEEDPLKIEVVV